MQNHRDAFVEADCKAICQFFNITYKASNKNNQSAPPSNKEFLVKVIYDGKEGLNVRKGPGVSYDIVLQVYHNDVFTIVEEKDGWGRLKSGAGWLSLNTKYIKKM